VCAQSPTPNPSQRSFIAVVSLPTCPPHMGPTRAGIALAASAALFTSSSALVLSRKNAAAPMDCYLENGASYVGLEDMTATGRTCKNWLTEGTYASTTAGIGNHNYCRNPEGSKEKPWCFTVDPKVPFEFCEVPACPNDGAAPEPWVAPAGSKRTDVPCTNAPSTAPTFTEWKAGRACMDNQGDKWWLISNEKSVAGTAEECEANCKTLPGTKFFTYWSGGGETNCGCYRECVLVSEDLTTNSPTVYRVQ